MYSRKEINFEVKDLPNNTLFDNPKLFCDFVNKLLNRKKELRLGSKGINEIIEHPWLQEFDWGKLLSGEMGSPFETEIYSENYDFDYANQKDEVDFNQYYKDLEKINKEDEYLEGKKSSIWDTIEYDNDIFEGKEEKKEEENNDIVKEKEEEDDIREENI